MFFHESTMNINILLQQHIVPYHTATVFMFRTPYSPVSRHYLFYSNTPNMFCRQEPLKILNRCQIIFDIDTWINEHRFVKQSTTRLILTPIYNSYIIPILISNIIKENSILAYITSAVQPPKNNLQPIIEHHWKRENITEH